MLLFAFDQHRILIILCEISKVNFRKKSIEDIGMYLFLLDLMHLALFDNFQFIEIIDFFQLLIDHQLSNRLNPPLILRHTRNIIHDFLSLG